MEQLLSIDNVTPDEYKKLIPDRKVFFNEPDFTELNKSKVDEIHYLVFKKGNSPRFGLILGVKDGIAKAPFSAPYSYPVVVDSYEHVELFDEAIEILEKYCKEEKIAEIQFTFPPFIYDEDTLSVWTNVFFRRKYEARNVDINYLLDLEKLNTDHYEQLITKKGRSHLRKAIASGIEIIRCNTEKEIQEAYDIVVENHSAKNRPTHMSLQQLTDTFSMVPHEVFLARQDGVPIASMIYYETAKGIAQCIYSGYLLQYSNSGVMNYLSWYAIQFYGNKGLKYIDRATATEDSVPNYGLCDFKDSVGGKRCLKYSFKKKL